MREITPAEVLRWLGNTQESGMEPRIQEAISLLQRNISPKHVYRFFPLSADGTSFTVEDAVFTGSGLSRNLKGCTKIAMMACTLGPEPDRLIRRAQVSSLFDTAVLQAVCTAMIEAYCDEVNQMIIRDAAEEQLYCRPRYSPGYGDLALESQREFFRILNITKTTGISLTEGCLMVPTKSVTAFVGLSPTDRNCVLSGCEECGMQDTCMYSRTEKPI